MHGLCLVYLIATRLIAQRPIAWIMVAAAWFVVWRCNPTLLERMGVFGGAVGFSLVLGMLLENRGALAERARLAGAGWRMLVASVLLTLLSALALSTLSLL